MRVPSGSTQLQESPCLPPVDSMMKCRASAGGLASWAAGVWANALDANRAARTASESLAWMVVSPKGRGGPRQEPGSILRAWPGVRQGHSKSKSTLPARAEGAELVAVEVAEIGAVEVVHPLPGRALAGPAGRQRGGMD